MALDLLNVGDSRATTKAKLDAAFDLMALPASGNTTEATDTFNDLVTDYLVDPLPGLTDGMDGGTARSRINAAITALNNGGGGGGSDLLALSSRIAFGENSYGAQTGNIDVLQWAWLKARCKGVPSLGMRQARGGDRLTHLHDRQAPLVATRAGLYVVMDDTNDLSDSAIANTTEGGQALIARLESVIEDIRAVGPSQILVRNSAATNGYNSKAIAGAFYNANIPVAPDITIVDTASVFNPQDSGQSSDGVHPNKRVSAKALGDLLGTTILSKFVEDDIFDAGGDLAGNLVTWNPATAWTVTTNSSGLSVLQSQNGTRRRFEITGTCASDEAGAGTTADVRMRISMPYKAARNTWGMSLASLFWLKISSSSDGAPVNLATFSALNGTGTAFNKQFTVAHGGYWTEKFEGPFGIMPGLLQGTSNASAVTFDLILRGVNGQVVDVVVEIDNVNHLATDDVAYGPATNASAAFTIGDGTNRPVLFSIPTSSPSGGSQALGTNVNISNSGTIIGGGLTDQIDAIRNGSQDVGDAVPVRSGAAAVPYTMASPLASGDTLVLRRTATNSMGSASVDTAPITVS